MWSGERADAPPIWTCESRHDWASPQVRYGRAPQVAYRPWTREGRWLCTSAATAASQRSAIPRRSWATSSRHPTGHGWSTVGNGVPAASVERATVIGIPTRSTLPAVGSVACNCVAGVAGMPRGWRSGSCMRWLMRPPSAQGAATSTCRSDWVRRHRENGHRGPTSVRQPAGRRLSQSDPPQVSGVLPGQVR